MKTSDSVKTIFKALHQFRCKLKQPSKNAYNKFFKNNYVPLENIVEAVDLAIEGTGLSYVQEPTCEGNTVSVSTNIFHESGEYILFEKLTLPASKADAQGLGSAMTYAKRYSLSAAFGVTSDEDDDGQAAVKHEEQGQHNNTQQAPQQISGRQLADLKDEARKVADASGIEPEVFLQKLCEMANIQTIDQLLEVDFGVARAELVKWKQGYQKKQEKADQEQQRTPESQTDKNIPWGQKQ